jgi:hypothetical protein
MLVDLTWKAVDVAHMACYSYFSHDPVQHHHFGLEIIRFFGILPLQQRWYFISIR